MDLEICSIYIRSSNIGRNCIGDIRRIKRDKFNGMTDQKKSKIDTYLLIAITAMISIIGYFYVSNDQNLKATDDAHSQALIELLEGQEEFKSVYNKGHQDVLYVLDTTIAWSRRMRANIKKNTIRSTENKEDIIKVKTKIGLY